LIAADTSALIAVAFGEPEAPAFAKALAIENVVIGAPTAFEATMVALSRGSAAAQAVVAEIIDHSNVRIVPFGSIEHAIAQAAFMAFGKGRGHPAQLNFGDCMAYAVAKAHDAPLLFKGKDFVHTDLRPALPQPAPE
jgi:ribonuclease VapC